MSKGFASSYRIVLLATGLFGCFAVLGGRLVWLHYLNRDELLKSVVKARGQITVEKARRGDIFDTRGAILATSRPLILVAVDPWAVREEDAPKFPKLAALLGLSDAELRECFASKFRAPEKRPAGSAPDAISFKPATSTSPETAVANPPDETERGLENPDDTGRRQRHWVKLSDNVTETTYAQIEKLGIRGLCPPERAYSRVYPHGSLAAHVIGYVNKALQPMTGIENYANIYLRGQDGWRESEKDGLRRELAQFRTREVPRADGYSVKLSIDCNVQDIIEQELIYIAQRFQPEKATIIVSDPRDGFILGMGNYPTFDLNEYAKVPKEAQASMKNIAVTDILEPGSTFKIVSVGAALDEGVINLNDRFDCNSDKVEYQGKLYRLPKDDHHYDHDLNVPEVIARSSNRGAAQIGIRLGEQKLYDYARAFGFARPLGFPTGGEVAGILAKPEKWSGTDITRIPMGHTIAATPLQMHMAMSTIATGGVLLRPQIIQEIKDSSGETVSRYQRTEIGRAVSEHTAQTMARMLMGVASKEGTAPEAAIPGYEVAGKTGTTQMIIDGKYSEQHHIGSFVGFFPASDPQIAITVIVHNADAREHGGWGAKVAAPSFKKIGEQLIAYRDIKPPATNSPSRVTLALVGGRP
jgi:cell division protein FtsI (penicillin-binding protein 3)